MSDNILIEEVAADPTTLVINPLFTYRSFAQGNVAQEWITLQGRLDPPEIKNIIIDLAAIPFFGSTVLEWMVHIWKRLKEKSGHLVLCNVSEVGLQILQAARLNTVWPTFANREEAQQWLASQK